MAAQRAPRWGWHELDSRAARRLVADAGIERGDLVLDVGAGTGAITGALVAAGASVIAIELHPGRRGELARRFAGAAVIVANADAADLRLPRRPFKVVANPPFAVAMAIVRRLLAAGSRLESADLVVPHYVAQRWIAPSAPGRGRWGRCYSVTLTPAPPRSAFRPPPPGRIAVLRIRAVPVRS